MTATNGRANGSAIENRSELVAPTRVPPAMTRPSTDPQFSTSQIKELIAELEVRFNPAVIEWRVTNTTKLGKRRGQVIPYADPRAYTDRLNSLFTPAGWTRKYTVHTSANFQRSPDQKNVAKVFVTCELSIFGGVVALYSVFSASHGSSCEARCLAAGMPTLLSLRPAKQPKESSPDPKEWVQTEAARSASSEQREAGAERDANYN